MYYQGTYYSDSDINDWDKELKQELESATIPEVIEDIKADLQLVNDISNKSGAPLTYN
jgi:hypothetical protein